MSEVSQEEYKIQVLVKRIGELVSSYEERASDLRIGNTLLSQELTTLREENANLREHIRILEENVNVQSQEPTPQAPSEIITDEAD